MSRIGVAFAAFFQSLFDAKSAQRIAEALENPAHKRPTTPAAIPAPAPKPTPPAPTRSDAITLLALLQREARLVDLVQQPLTGFTDDQIGAAARDVLTNTATVLKRVLDIAPASSEDEGASITIPADYDAGATTLSGNVPSTGPYNGKIVHAGWKAKKCDLPAWTGGKAAAMVIAPVEVEVN